MQFTEDEQKVIDYAKQDLKQKIWKFKSDNTYNPGCFVMSTSGKIYHGIAFDDINDWLHPVHAEVVALATMFTEEGPDSKIKVLLIMSGGDDGPNHPCGSCRDYIKVFGDPKLSIIGSNLSMTEFQKWKIEQILPDPEQIGKIHRVTTY